MSSSKKVFDLFSVSEARNVLFGIATLWIGLFHSDNLMATAKFYIDSPFWYNAFRIFRGTGNVGVDMFLFLSGIGLYFSYTKDRHVLSFWKKRLMRVLPTAILIAVFYFSIRYVEGRAKSGPLHYLSRISFTYFFYKGERVFWFISLILALYVAFPIFYKIIERFRLGGMLGLCAAVIVFAFLLRTFMAWRYCKWEVALWRVPVFIVGIWAGKFVMEKKKISRHWLWLFLAVAIGALTFMCFYTPMIKALVPGYDGSIERVERMHIWLYRFPGSILGACLVILDAYVITAIRRKGRCNVLRNFFEFVGMYSMEYYMIYLNLNHFLERVFTIGPRHEVMLYFGSFVVSLALCVIVRKVCDEFMTYMQRKPKDWEKLRNSRRKKT